ncbi:TPA: DUF4949 domain-containing protein [Legionella pneumophila]|uniref:DUF4949 domain-containing protein n=1 Tax=Legionella pneumophila TaxID=446 RepID=UPI000786BD9D|nr:DUF4949 domain-containing protein [Legionella pneumophila]HAT1882570.1 DUF4949 domain-containing protein [Legionella pneumophila]HAT2113882.1 DUF4949 domain-containing protein [Legionella pneumophila]HAT8720888.1 DUF4949 domain-containing protein [Legionella pneumophila]HAU1191010.1 DUF4949 domain-containing protein [Legionella pneumophila]HBD7101723.1 DUF4949 domain-containing protein [Legionella pneumophila]
MMLKTKLTAFISAVILAGSSLANQIKPEVCPSVPSIQSEGMSMSAEILEGMYITYNLSHYNTSSNWVFIVGPIAADNDDMALAESNKLLSTMSGSPHPEDDGEGNWICQYNTESKDIIAFAIEADDMFSPLKMMRYFRTVR